jgi:S-adenosylmethionine hydrolase
MKIDSGMLKIVEYLKSLKSGDRVTIQEIARGCGWGYFPIKQTKAVMELAPKALSREKSGRNVLYVVGEQSALDSLIEDSAKQAVEKKSVRELSKSAKSPAAKATGYIDQFGTVAPIVKEKKVKKVKAPKSLDEVFGPDVKSPNAEANTKAAREYQDKLIDDQLADFIGEVKK